MSRLTRAELIDHRARLSKWQTPADMAAYVSAVNSAIGSADFFGQGGLEFLRDAWLAAEFGRHTRSEAVRLIPESDRWPDFEARDGVNIERVECAEADVPGRRRGDEYREKAKRRGNDRFSVEHDPVENWIARAEQVPAALASTISAKLAKQYGPQASLLVYLNIGEFGIRQAEIEAAMAPAVAPALASFQRAWILWRGKLYGPWTAISTPTFSASE